MPALADLALGARCVGCRRPGQPLCATCHRRLLLGQPEPVPLATPADRTAPVWAARPYAGLPRALVIAHKERGVLALATPLGALLASAVTALLAATPSPAAGSLVVLAPVPSRSAQTRRRRHDPVLRAACAAAALLSSMPTAPGGVAVRRALRHRRLVADQAGLGRAERAANLSGALGVPRRYLPAAGCVVVVVDDVCTTGATLAEAFRALDAAGRPALGAAVVCRAAAR